MPNNSSGAGGTASRPPGVLKKGTAFCELKPATLAKMLMKETGLMTPTPCGQPTSRRRWSEPPRWRPPSRSMGFVGVDRSYKQPISAAGRSR